MSKHSMPLMGANEARGIKLDIDRDRRSRRIGADELVSVDFHKLIRLCDTAIALSERDRQEARHAERSENETAKRLAMLLLGELGIDGYQREIIDVEQLKKLAPLSKPKCATPI